MMVLITISLGVVHEMAARFGAATGRGRLDLVRQRYGIDWGVVLVAVVLVANGGVIVSEFMGIAAAADLLGVSRYAAVPAAAALVWYLIIAGSYHQVERVFLAMALVFFAYPVAAVLAGSDWGAVERGAAIPTLRAEPAYILLQVGTIGTTIPPYMRLFQESSVVEIGVARRHVADERLDVYVAALLSKLIAAFIIITTAATLHVSGRTEVETAAQAAEALRPVAGDAAGLLFAVGLLGASLFAAAVLPLATAYAVSETFGLPNGVGLDFRRGTFVLRMYSALVALGAAVALIPGIRIIDLLVAIQVLNGALLPIILIFLLRLLGDRQLAGDLHNGPVSSTLGRGAFALVTAAVAAMLGTQAAGALGLPPFG